ncbi:hypothetical protein ACFY4C_35425 [Actinomadura viridis]|uniref:hypothetical protein n=1 Tax=Actinomadura viridis TaxID=58110 RepID=UPI0036B2ADEC
MADTAMQGPNTREDADIPGWGVIRGEDGQSWRAYRIADLTSAQIARGCKAEVQAPTFGGLKVACLGEDTLAELIAAGERLRERMANEEHSWRIWAAEAR